jgi:hypothetical protein
VTALVCRVLRGETAESYEGVDDGHTWLPESLYSHLSAYDCPKFFRVWGDAYEMKGKCEMLKRMMHKCVPMVVCVCDGRIRQSESESDI